MGPRLLFTAAGDDPYTSISESRGSTQARVIYCFTLHTVANPMTVEWLQVPVAGVSLLHCFLCTERVGKESLLASQGGVRRGRGGGRRRGAESGGGGDGRRSIPSPSRPSPPSAAPTSFLSPEVGHLASFTRDIRILTGRAAPSARDMEFRANSSAAVLCTATPVADMDGDGWRVMPPPPLSSP
eukprot:gene12764-biopygen9424